MRILRAILRYSMWTLAWFGALIGAAWAAGALYFDAPFGGWNGTAAVGFVLALLTGVLFLRNPMGKWLSVLGGFLLVLAWWCTLQPTNEANWQPDVTQLPWAEIQGDEVTLHNVRDCDYRSKTDYTPRWETRKVRLSQITGVDLAINYWGSPWIAHPILSFQFADAAPVCFSIETRRKVGQIYSAVGGLYRQYELIYIAANERDVIRVRTNYNGEDIYLYRTATTPAEAQKRFLEYLRTINEMRAQPRWYNAITTNCTTSIREQHPASERIPWDWRLLLNGKSDELMFETRTILTGGLPFEELKARSLINAAAKAADAAPDFSQRIREGLPQGN